jgi:hypothetical protein
MGKVNLSRVILGGILAGIIVNISEGVLHEVVLKSQMDEAMKALGKSVPTGGGTLAVWLIYGFAWAIAAVWLYAAIRPRYGPGPATAARAGLVAWFFCCLLSSVAMMNLGLFPFNPVEFVWELVQAIVATMVGAWVYKETPV